MAVVALVTCNQWPELSESDRRYADALTARGMTVEAAPWNGPREPFLRADAIVLRSNWDYHHHLDAFVEWIEDLDRHGKLIFNPPTLVRWNIDKRYLLDLGSKGMRIPDTHVVAPDPAALSRLLSELGWERAVVKPSVGASGHNVHLVRGADIQPLADVLHTKNAPHLLVQEFMPEVGRSGEVSCTFFDGAFSHAVLKRPATGEYRVNSAYGGAVEPFQPSDDLVRQAGAVLRLLPEVPLYARVDGVVHARDFILMELELNEPSLMLQFDAGAAERFADATLRRLTC